MATGACQGEHASTRRMLMAREVRNGPHATEGSVTDCHVSKQSRGIFAGSVSTAESDAFALKTARLGPCEKVDATVRIENRGDRFGGLL